MSWAPGCVRMRCAGRQRVRDITRTLTHTPRDTANDPFQACDPWDPLSTPGTPWDPLGPLWGPPRRSLGPPGTPWDPYTAKLRRT
eukprot:5071636-Prymnesium_polylepis.3